MSEFFYIYYRKNPRGVLISPGPGKDYTLVLFSVRDDEEEAFKIRNRVVKIVKLHVSSS